MSQQTRRHLLSAAAALLGLALAASLLFFWRHLPARPGQLASAATRDGLDASAAFRFVATLILFPTLAAALLKPVTRRIADAPHSWPVQLVVWSAVVAMWQAASGAGPLWTGAPPIAAFAVAFLLRERDLRFTRYDVVLLPAFLTAYVAVIDLARMSAERTVLVSAALVLAARIGVGLLPGSVTHATCFALAPLGLLLQTNHFARDQRQLGWPALALALVTPFVLRFVARREVPLRWALTRVVYPLAIYALANVGSLATGEGKPRLNFFEDAHHLATASEMLRGEQLYRDVVPVHGLVEDGLSSWLALRFGEQSAGTALRARNVLAGLTNVAVYALAMAATGSAEAGLLAAIAAPMLYPGASGTIRWIPALVTLAILAAAVRLRRRRLFFAAGAVAAGAVLTSLDFGAYSVVAVTVAAIRFRPGALRAIGLAAAGAAIVALPLLGWFLVRGSAPDLIRTTLVELPSVSSTGASVVFRAPAVLAERRAPPEYLAALFEPSSALFLIWAALALFAAAGLCYRATRRTEPLLLVAVWTTLSAISYAQRQHMFFVIVVAPALVIAAFLLFRRARAAGWIAVVVLAVMARPAGLLQVLGGLRQMTAPAAGWTELPQFPRARGVFVSERDRAIIETSARYLEQRLGPGETFFDFSDRGVLYYLLDRPMPVRYPVVVFYQTESLQREVIRALEADHSVRAVLMPLGPTHGLDGIGNELRAPLVHAWLQQNFEPDFAEGEVVFWRRR